MPQRIGTLGRLALVLVAVICESRAALAQVPSPPRRKASQLDRAVKIVSEVEGETTLLKLATHGSRVKQGDVICELDDSAIRESLGRQSIVTEQARQAAHSAETELSLAKLRQSEFQEGTASNAELTASGAVDLAREAEAQAKREYDLLAKRLPAGEGPVLRAKLRLSQATSRRTMAEGKLAALRKIEQEGSKSLQLLLQQAQQTVKLRQAMLKLEQAKLDKLQTQAEMCTITAPCDGLVMIAPPSKPDGRPVAEGELVTEKQLLMQIVPDPAVRPAP
jgi:multidrug resistance efflux pump